jgi:hypothetical protein
LRPITEREEEAHDEQPEIEVVEDDVNDVDLRNVGFERLGENDEGNVVVTLMRMSVMTVV